MISPTDPFSGMGELESTAVISSVFQLICKSLEAELDSFVIMASHFKSGTNVSRHVLSVADSCSFLETKCVIPGNLLGLKQDIPSCQTSLSSKVSKAVPLLLV